MFVDGFARAVMGRWLGGRGTPSEAIGSQLEADRGHVVGLGFVCKCSSLATTKFTEAKSDSLLRS